jgi:predicted metal-dependent hydrolase
MNYQSNLNLVKAPDEVIDYVILRVCHFKIKGHSYKFWRLVFGYMPDYKQKMDWLEVNSKNLV